MSSTAEKMNPETNSWELVRAVNLSDGDRKYQYRCASCHAPSILAICTDKDNYFLSKEHTIDCPVAKGHKLIRINTHTEIDLDAILNHEDHDPPRTEVPAPEDDHEEFEPDPNNTEDPNADLRLDPDATRSIRSASGMYKELVERHGSDFIDSFASREVDSIFLRRNTLQKFKEDWGNSLKLIVAKRFLPKNLKYNIPVPKGYVLLRDAYSHDDEDSIYFMVRMIHPEHDKRFKMNLFGRTETTETGEQIKGIGRDRHRNIVILANWHNVPHNHYRIYRADLNSRMVTFVNAPDAK